MPRYSFECTCGLRFERNLKTGIYKSHPCPECKGDAPLVVSEFGFAFAGGNTPGNSGVHDHDYPTADKAVGRSAAEKWAAIREREKAKQTLRDAAGTSALMRRSGPGYVEYEAMSKRGQEARKNLARDAFAALRAQKKRS